MTARKTCAVVMLGFFAALGSGLLRPGSAVAQETCNGFLSIDYPQIPTFPNCGALGPRCTANQVTQECDCCVIPNDIVTMRVTLGAGEILGGSFLQVFNFLAGLDCQRFSVVPGVDPECRTNPDGPRVEFIGNVVTTCPNTWLVNPLPVPPFAELSFEFRANPIDGLQVPENDLDFCSVDFQFRALDPPSDSACTTGPAPLPCCTGAGTGFCQASDNAACTDVLEPYPCCTGFGTGILWSQQLGLHGHLHAGPLLLRRGHRDLLQRQGIQRDLHDRCGTVQLLHRRGYGVLPTRGQRGLHPPVPAVSLLHRPGQGDLWRHIPARPLRRRGVRQ